MKRWESPVRSLRVATVLCAAVSVLASANTLDNDFTYDDRSVVLENESIHSVGSLPGTVLKPYWPNAYGKEQGLWRPVTTLAFGVQWALWDGAPVGFHAVNVLMNAVAAGLVVILLGHLVPLGAAFLAGLVFAVHPVHVEAVANVVGFAEIFSAVLYLVACILVVRRPAGMGVLRTGLICGVFALAFLTKESAITFPAVVLLLDSCRREIKLQDWRRYLRNRGALYAGLALTAGAVLTARAYVLGSLAEALPPLGAGILVAGVPRIWTVLSTWPEILRLLFFPADLSAEYAPEVISIAHGWTPQAVLGFLIGIGALVGALAMWRSKRLSTRSSSPRLLAFAVVWFVITLSPTSNVLFLTGVMLAERTLYLPSVGFVAGVGWLLWTLHKERPRVAIGLATVCVVLLAGRTVQRNTTWKSNDTLFVTMLSEHPESARAQLVAGNMHFQRGEDEQGLRAYGRAIGMSGTHYAVLTEISRTLLRHEYEDLGEYLLTLAWKEYPQYSLAPSQLAILYSQQQRWEEAERLARLTARTVGDKAGYTHLLAQALAAQDRLDEAVVARREAIGLGLDRAQQWIWLSELELRRGDTVAATHHLNTARTRVTGPRELAAVDSLRLLLGGGGVDSP